MRLWRVVGRLGVLAACQIASAAVLRPAARGDRSPRQDPDEAAAPSGEKVGGGRSAGDRSPGGHGNEHVDVAKGVRGYAIGLGLALLLTGASFYVAGGSTLVWTPGIPVALVALALAQMGAHLVFFLHITTAPDNTNNVLALAFGVLVVVLVLGGSLWIMANLNHNMMPMEGIIRMQR